jgi:hypothetical protein
MFAGNAKKFETASAKKSKHPLSYPSERVTRAFAASKYSLAHQIAVLGIREANWSEILKEVCIEQSENVFKGAHGGPQRRYRTLRQS